VVRSAALAVFWGLAALALGLLHIKLPGTQSTATDLGESALIASAFTLPSAWLTLIPCAIYALATPDSLSIAFSTTFVMHAVAVPVAWQVHRALRKREPGHVALGLGWASFIVIYYLGLLVPTLVAAHWALGRVAVGAMGSLYFKVAGAFTVEMIFTAGITSFAFITKEELARRRRAEGHLREALETQRAMLVSAPVAVIGVDAAGKVSEWNPAAERLFGRSAKQAIGGAAPRCGRASAGDSSMLELVPSGESVQGVQAQVIGANGAAIPVEISGAPVRDASGAAVGAVLLVEDLREQLAMRAQVQRSATMSALGQLVGGVAHEVRNPLFGISATLDAFGPKLSGQPELQLMDKTLRGQVEQINSLMLDLLDYGKPGIGERSVGTVDAPLRVAVSDCAAQAAAAGVLLELALPAGLPLVSMDSARLLQVFRNLIQNAVAFSPRGETVRVEASVEPALGRAFVRAEVLDRGPGFKPEELAGVFEPFFTRRKGGTGLGLSIVQRIVEQHGGNVEAQNRPGGGARLLVRFPAAPEQEGAG
jgi:PAS domain S-box-containing protein